MELFWLTFEILQPHERIGEVAGRKKFEGTSETTDGIYDGQNETIMILTEMLNLIIYL